MPVNRIVQFILYRTEKSIRPLIVRHIIGRKRKNIAYLLQQVIKVIRQSCRSFNGRIFQTLLTEDKTFTHQLAQLLSSPNAKLRSPHAIHAVPHGYYPIQIVKFDLSLHLPLALNPNCQVFLDCSFLLKLTALHNMRHVQTDILLPYGEAIIRK